ncbi:hypothetical protein PtB15_13B568 [Puccinia triticina]|nr:hypothetical protein PtB15_13B568 [Puccinia triticina]
MLWVGILAGSVDPQDGMIQIHGGIKLPGSEAQPDGGSDGDPDEGPENPDSTPYWIGGPETDDWTVLDLWELRPLQNVPCPDCARDPNRTIPEQKKSMPYPYGSMSKVYSGSGLSVSGIDYYRPTIGEDQGAIDQTGMALPQLLNLGKDLDPRQIQHNKIQQLNNKTR